VSKARRPGPESDTSRWSFHFAVHAIDANQAQFVLGIDQGGLTGAQARSVVADLGQANRGRCSQEGRC
jgi:nitrous oxide reductase accessory protein NosL